MFESADLSDEEIKAILNYKFSKPVGDKYLEYIRLLHKSVNEVSLFEQAEDFHLPIYRFWFFPMELVTNVLIIQYKIDCVQLTVKCDRPYVTSTRILSAPEVKNLEQVVTNQSFWNLPLRIDRNGIDGYAFLLEGIVNENYHIVVRWVPTDDDPFKAVCDYMYPLFKTVDLD